MFFNLEQSSSLLPQSYLIFKLRTILSKVLIFFSLVATKLKLFEQTWAWSLPDFLSLCVQVSYSSFLLCLWQQWDLNLGQPSLPTFE